MKISVIKSANEVVIGSLQVTNQKLAKAMITLNDIKNNLKKPRHTHWVKVSFEGVGSIELGDEPVCIGDYDEYPISPDTKVIMPIDETDDSHKQYVCSTLNTPTLLQNKTLTENEEIIIVYTEIINEKGSGKAVNEMLLNAMKRCLFEYQMKAYNDHAGQGMDRQLFDKRVFQILNIMPDLERLMEQESTSSQAQSLQDTAIRFEQSDVPLEQAVISHEDEILQHEQTEAEADQREELWGGEEEVSDTDKEEDTVDIQGGGVIQQEEHSLNKEDQQADAFEDEDEDKTERLGNIMDMQEDEEQNSVKWVKIDMQGKNNK